MNQAVSIPLASATASSAVHGVLTSAVFCCWSCSTCNYPCAGCSADNYTLDILRLQRAGVQPAGVLLVSSHTDLKNRTRATATVTKDCPYCVVGERASHVCALASK